MKRTVLILAVTLVLGILLGAIGGEVVAQMKRATLLRTDLASAEGMEAILQLVDLEPGVTGKTHYHPGEEIVYLLEGSLFLGLEGKPDVTMEPGDAFYMLPEQVHFGKTTTEAAKILVFRVHPKGQPITVAQ